MLMIWDNQAKHEAEDRELRLALLASGQFSPEKLFPDQLGAPKTDDPQEGESEGEVYEYESPGEDFEKILAQMRAHRQVTTTEASQTTEGVTGDAIPLGPDDTEWI